MGNAENEKRVWTGAFHEYKYTCHFLRFSTITQKTRKKCMVSFFLSFFLFTFLLQPKCMRADRKSLRCGVFFPKVELVLLCWRTHVITDFRAGRKCHLTHTHINQPTQTYSHVYIYFVHFLSFCCCCYCSRSSCYSQFQHFPPVDFLPGYRFFGSADSCLLL